MTRRQDRKRAKRQEDSLPPCRRAVLPSVFLAVLTFGPGVASQAPRTELDHIILAINNLDSGIAEFTRLTGVVPQRGGQHPGRNTENALVSLGNGAYLEILAPISSLPNPDAVIPFRSLAIGGWAIHPSSLEQAVQRLKEAGFEPVPIAPGSRRTTDGRLLEWRTSGARGEGLSMAPFLIEWSAASPHPSTTSPTGCRLESLDIRESDPAALQKFFTAVGFAGTVSARSRGMVANVACPKGKVAFATLE
jgi:hypothetical protein